MVLRKHRTRIFIENEDFHVTLCKDGSDIELNALIIPGTQNRGGFKARHLSNVRSAVEKELEHLIDTYTPNLTYQVCIKCPCASHHEGDLLPGSEDTDDRCVAIREGKAKVICERSATEVIDCDLQLWYGVGKSTKDGTAADNVLNLSVANLDISQPESRCNRISSVLTVGHEWSNEKGGLAAIHRLTSSLAAKTGQKVHATVIEANEKEQQDAASQEVQLMLPIDDEGTDDKPSLVWLTKYHSYHYPSLKHMPGVNVVIGHLTTTSKAALDIQRECFPGKKVILFNHVLPEDTEVNRDNFTPTRVQEKEAILCNDVGRSNVVFSVGPRVYHHFENQFSMLTSVKHELFLPMPDEAFFQLTIKKPSTESQPQILTYGRIGNVAHLNGYDVIARGLSESADGIKKSRPTLSPLVWKITGVQEGQIQSAHDYINDHVTSGYLDWKLVPNGQWSRSNLPYRKAIFA
ncbi:uncharacterized protein [Ptychodera flava]|uniref:uncharacterized protein n=1 Tax=Ptychodera flava TaxID=63121 RepID=UPI003969CCB7